MSAIPAYITSGLRFPADEIQCRGGRWPNGCAAADGEAAYAIHTVEGRHYCAYHSPFDNQYVPCLTCGTKPALTHPTEDPVCDDCLNVTEDEPTKPHEHSLSLGDWVYLFDAWHPVLDLDDVQFVADHMTAHMTAEEVRARMPRL